MAYYPYRRRYWHRKKFYRRRYGNRFYRRGGRQKSNQYAVRNRKPKRTWWQALGQWEREQGPIEHPPNLNQYFDNRDRAFQRMQRMANWLRQHTGLNNMIPQLGWDFFNGGNDGAGPMRLEL